MSRQECLLLLEQRHVCGPLIPSGDHAVAGFLLDGPDFTRSLRNSSVIETLPVLTLTERHYQEH